MYATRDEKFGDSGNKVATECQSLRALLLKFLKSIVLDVRVEKRLPWLWLMINRLLTRAMSIF